MAAIFAHSSSGPVPLRTLTLGVLIVSGGTLAALPFRRYQATPDSSTTPVHVTGPTHSALQMGATSPVSDASFAPPQMAEAILPGSILATHAETPGVREEQQHSSSPDCITSLANAQPSHGGPLTYEDLVLPIEMPDIVQQRFNATAAVKSIQMEKERFIKTDNPKMQPMTATSSDPPNSADTSLFESPSRNEVASRSVLKPSVNQSATRQTDGTQQPQMPTSGSNPHTSASRVIGAHANGSAPRMAAWPEPTLAELPAAKDSTAGSLASASKPHHTSAGQTVPANPTDPETLPVTDSKRLLPSADSPSRARHWIQQPD